MKKFCMVLTGLLPAVVALGAIEVGKRQTFDTDAPGWTLEDASVTNAELQVAGAAESAITAEQISQKTSTVLKMKLGFTVPGTTPVYADVIGSETKLIVVPNSAGKLMISDAATSNFVETADTVEDGDTRDLLISAFLENNALKFRVVISGGAVMTTNVVTAANATTPALNGVLLVGEGSADDILLSQAALDIVPDDGGAEQSPELVAEYGDWLADVADDVSGKTDAQLADAFAMNVPASAAPSLKITDIEQAGENAVVVIEGVRTDTDATVPLSNINGVLTVISCNDLSATTRTTNKVNVVVGATKVRVAVPSAKFVKASIAVSPVTTGDPVSGESAD